MTEKNQKIRKRKASVSEIASRNESEGRNKSDRAEACIKPIGGFVRFRKLWAVAMVFMLMLAMMPITAMADDVPEFNLMSSSDNVAMVQVGDGEPTYYLKFSDAFSALNTNGGTLTLLKDVSHNSSSFTLTKTATIDFQNFKGDFQIFVYNSTLTVKGNQNQNAGYDCLSMFAVDFGGTVVVEEGAFVDVSLADGAKKAIIKGGYIKSINSTEDSLAPIEISGGEFENINEIALRNCVLADGYDYQKFDGTISKTISTADFGTDSVTGKTKTVKVVSHTHDFGETGTCDCGETAISCDDSEKFPDENFRNWLKGRFDKNSDGWYTNAELDAVTQISFLSNDNPEQPGGIVGSIKGIEYFKNLDRFVIDIVFSEYFSNLTSVDFSKNTALKKLTIECGDSEGNRFIPLEEVILPEGDNPVLENFALKDAPITSMDLSKYTNLKGLVLNYSDIGGKLDLRNHTKLTSVLVNDTKIKSVDLCKTCEFATNSSKSFTTMTAWSDKCTYNQSTKKWEFNLGNHIDKSKVTIDSDSLNGGTYDSTTGVISFDSSTAFPVSFSYSYDMGNTNALKFKSTVTLSLAKRLPVPSDFKFTAPENLTYTGEAKVAKVEKNSAGLGEISFKYYKGGAEATPLDAGTYTVKATSAEGTGILATTSEIEVGTFTIAKATPEFDMPVSLNATYGDKLSDIEFPKFANGKLKWEKDEATLVGNAGGNKFNLIFVPNDGDNYNEVKFEVTVNVGKATPVFDKPLTFNATYGDKLSDIELPKFTNGELKWEKGDATLVGDAGDNKFNLIFVPTDGSNYNEVKFEVTVNVAKADNSFTKQLTIAGWTYGEKANKPEATAVDGTVTFKYSDKLDGTYTDNEPANAGEYYVKAIVAEGANYKALESAPVKFTIAKADNSFTKQLSIAGWTYGKKANDPEATAVDGTVTFKYSNSENGTYTDDVPKNAGDYYVKAIVAEGTNYNALESTPVKFIIAKATPVESKKTTASVQNGKALKSGSVSEGEFTGVDGKPLAGEILWVDGSDFASGSGTKKMKFKPENENYSEVEFDVEVSTYSVGGGSVSGSAKASYTISFETNGGEKIVSQTVKKNGKVTEPKAPEKEGYTFAGWYTDSKLKNEYDFDTKVTKSFTLYAKWEDEAQEPSEDDEKEPSSNEWKNPFSDVLEADWFFESVRYVNQVGLMNGMSEDEFMPTENITRGMLVATLYRLEGEPAIMNKSIPFSDVKADSYYFEAISWAEQNEIVSGVNENEFMPDENITREQIAVILYRYAKYKGYDVSVGEDTNILSYEDFADISEYAIEGVQYAVGSGIMTGKTESAFCPKDFATRAEIATVLERFCRSEK